MSRFAYKCLMVGFGCAATVCNLMHHWETGSFFFGWALGIAFCLPDLPPASPDSEGSQQ